MERLGDPCPEPMVDVDVLYGGGAVDVTITVGVAQGPPTTTVGRAAQL